MLARLADVQLLDQVARHLDYRSTARLLVAWPHLRGAGLGAGAPAVRALHHDNRDVRLRGLRALYDLGERAGPNAPWVNALMLSEYSYLQAVGVQALGYLGSHAVPYLDTAVALFQDESPYIRDRAAEALGNLGRHAAPHALSLVPLLADTDGFVRTSAVGSLARLLRSQLILTEEKRRVTSEVARLAESHSFAVARRAAFDLLALAPSELGAELAPMLARGGGVMLTDPRPDVRHSAVAALASLAPSSPAPVVAKLAALATDAGSRAAATEAMAHIASNVDSRIFARDFLDEVCELMEVAGDASAVVRSNAERLGALRLLLAARTKAQPRHARTAMRLLLETASEPESTSLMMQLMQPNTTTRI